MVPFVDVHVHLLAGLDDGPRTMEDALAMCRIARTDGIGSMAATCHQNTRWQVTPAQIRTATEELRAALQRETIAITVYANSEVTARPETPRDWREGKLLTVADKGNYLLIEMPRGAFVDLLPTVKQLRQDGVRTILAHPEKEPELLHGNGLIEALIDAGCLVQVSASSVIDPKDEEERSAVETWFKRGIVHLLASDGHSPRRRLPQMSEAYQEISRWIGRPAADRIARDNGQAIVNGLKLRVRRPLEPVRKGWFARWF